MTDTIKAKEAKKPGPKKWYLAVHQPNTETGAWYMASGNLRETYREAHTDLRNDWPSKSVQRQVIEMELPELPEEDNE